MTRGEKFKNWLHYNWYWLVIGAVLLSIGASILWNALGIGRVKPDYVFAYIGHEAISDDEADAFREAVASLGRDVNGDGKVVVELKQYTQSRTEDIEMMLYYGYAADTQLIADITKGDSYFFLVEEPDEVQRSFQIFADADGNAPDEYDHSTEDKVFLLKTCSRLSSLLTDDSAIQKLWIGRRYYLNEKGGHEADAELWKLITEGN